MKAALAILLSAVIAPACAVRTNQYYLPADATLAVEGTTCGSVPYGHTNLPLGEGLRVSVSAIPSQESIGLSIQLPLPLGAKVRFLPPEMVVEDPSTGRSAAARLAPFRVSVYGEGKRAGHVELVPPDAPLEGKGRNARLATPDTKYLVNDLHISSATVGAVPSQSVVLVFPAVEVNGVVTEVRRIPLRLVSKTGVLACVQ